MISFVGVMFFIFLVWEAFIVRREVVAPDFSSSSLEWQYSSFPPLHHTYDETPFVVVINK